MKMIIPSKIKRRTMKKVLIRVSIFVIILILLVSAFIFLKPLAALERNNKILTFYIGVFLDIAVTGVPFKLIRRSWQGEVLGVKIKSLNYIYHILFMLSLYLLYINYFL